MPRFRFFRSVLARRLLPLAAATALLAFPARADGDGPRWVGTWSAAGYAAMGNSIDLSLFRGDGGDD